MDDTIFNCKSLIIGHRGIKGEIMENTLESVIASIESGVDGVEFDVQRCFTGEIVLFHDKTLDRLAFKDQFYFNKTRNKPLSKLQWYHLYNTELIDTMGRKYKIPQLKSVLRHPKVYNSDVLINIDIKDTNSSEDIGDILTDLIEEGLYSPDRFMVSSESIEVLCYFAELKAEMEPSYQKFQNFKIGWIVSQENIPPCGIPFLVKYYSKVLTHVSIDKDITNSYIVEEIKKLGISVFVYTINEFGELPFGNIENIVDGIISDKPRNICKLGVLN